MSTLQRCEPLPGAEWLAAAADALAWPLWLLDAQGRLRHANRAGMAALRSGATLRRAADGRVGPADPALSAEFETALQAALQGRCTVLHRVGRNGPVSLTLTPLRVPTTTPTTPTTPGAPAPETPALVLLAAPAQPGSDVAGFAALHGLSAAETRVLEQLARGRRGAELARALGLQTSTVRSQLVTMRRRTGHRSVAELLRALSALPPLAPLAPDWARRGARPR